MDTDTKVGLHALETVTKKVAHKATEATGEFIGNKIADKIGKPKAAPNEKWRDVKEIVIPPEKQEEILNE